MKIDEDVAKVLEEANDFIALPNKIIKSLLGKVQLYTYNDPRYSDSGLVDDDFDDEDMYNPEYKDMIKAAEKAGIVTIKNGAEVYLNDRVPCKIELTKAIRDFNCVLHGLDKNGNDVFQMDLYLDASDDKWFQIKADDIPGELILNVLKYSELPIDTKKSLLSKLSKDELIELALNECKA